MMAMNVWSVFLYTLGFLCAAFLLKSWRQRRLRGGLPLPPGPTGLPFFGNVLELDVIHPWLSYEKWGKKYGGILYLNVLGKDFIIICSAKVAQDLVVRRSGIYSERPYVVTNELFGLDFNSGLLPYGNDWRLHRKLYNTAFNKVTTCQYEPIAISKARQLAENMLDTPEDYHQHCRTFGTATIMAVVYGHEVLPKNDPFVTKIEHFIRLFATLIRSEMATFLFVFPFLPHIPTWLPGGNINQRVMECRMIAKEILSEPVQYVKDNMAAGTARESLVRMALEAGDGKMDEDVIKGVATSAFLGGSETTDSTLRVFILAMVLHPEVQDKAREEIDQVVGSGRLPEFGDRPNLPYIEAICLETLRWLPVVPDALPHMTASSDVYEGMYIPKGATVLTSIWTMGHDETSHDDPTAFRPERYLTPEGKLAQGTTNNSFGFGFGRRACPGKHLAAQNVWASIVTMLATLQFGKARDELGSEIEIKVEFTTGLSTAPKTFPCSITSRSSQAENLVRMRN